MGLGCRLLAFYGVGNYWYCVVHTFSSPHGQLLGNRALLWLSYLGNYAQGAYAFRKFNGGGATPNPVPLDQDKSMETVTATHQHAVN